MKNLIYISFFFSSIYSNAQTALNNIGNLQIHQNGQMGFHTNVINDGIFDENLGLAGFYGDIPLTVSGAFVSTFYDLEISNSTNVNLNTGINTTNNTNFVTGNFFTARNEPDNYLNFFKNAFYTGANNISKVDGYVAINNQQNFTFPVGDAQQLRPLILESTASNTFAKCAYFFENPNTPSTFNTNFDTERRSLEIGSVSTIEFWRLEGTQPSTIQISWNERSAIETLTDDSSLVIPVGWSKNRGQWVSLADAAAIGDLTQGIVQSVSFVPDDYEIITFGTLSLTTLGEGQLIDLDNFIVSANGDGINDSFIIPELELSPNNTVRIYDRYGLKVFEMDNYSNQFKGFANTGTIVFGREKGLPTGIYFYTVSIDDLGLEFQGFLYLTR